MLNILESFICLSVSGFRFEIPFPDSGFPGSRLLLFHTPRKWIDAGGADIVYSASWDS